MKIQKYKNKNENTKIQKYKNKKEGQMPFFFILLITSLY